MENMKDRLYSIPRREQFLVVVFTVGLSGLVYFYPFFTNFRITLGIVVLAMFLLVLESLPSILTATCSGLLVVFLRSVWGIWAQSELFSLYEELPALAYYIVYGCGFFLLRVRKAVVHGSFLLWFLLPVLDVASNLTELFLRDTTPGYQDVLLLVPALFTAAFIRTIFIILGYQLLLNYQKNILHKDHWNRYCELLILSAKLRAEWFYLQKSSTDMEKVMEKSYILYRDLLRDKTEVASQRADVALEVAREIHEIKKDYLRVTSGLQKILEIPPHGGTMMLSEIFFLVEQNTNRYLQQTGKNLVLSFELRNDLITDRYYTLTAILDNLLMNGMDACKSGVSLKVRQWAELGKLILEVEDGGCGITEEQKEFIFQAGYSTKYSHVTGKMSTGIGLVHVQNLACNLHGEVVLVQSEVGKTVFRVSIPVESLLVEYDASGAPK